MTEGDSVIPYPFEDGELSMQASQYFDHEHLTVIRPPGRWGRLDWHELWAYRELLWVMMTRDVRVRYKQSVLGSGWAILRPLLTMAIMTVVFGKLAKMPSDGLPYPIFVFAGLLPCFFFAASVAASASSLLCSSHLISKVYFPRLIVPFASIGAPLADLLVAMVILLMMMLWYGIGWTWNLLAAPLLLAAIVLAALGIGTLLAALTVSYRDFAHITPFLLQVWMYATPVIYPVSLVPKGWQWLLYLNPLTGLIEAFRAAFLGRPFELLPIAVSVAASMATLAAGVIYFEMVERRFAVVI